MYTFDHRLAISFLQSMRSSAPAPQLSPRSGSIVSGSGKILRARAVPEDSCVAPFGVVYCNP